MCQDHPNLVVTSKLPYGSLSETAWQFIAQLKHENREQIKKDIVNNIVHEQEEENRLNKTIYENYTKSESLKIENKLLKQLLKETQDKNELLNELLIKERQNNNFKNIKPHTFTEILTNAKPKNKRVPKLIIKKKQTTTTN